MVDSPATKYIIHAPKRRPGLKLITFILCFLAQTLILPVGGQNVRPAPQCPQLVIACPLDMVEQDTQLRFSAMVASRDANPSLTYTWSLTSGRISEGQGTPSIIVDTTGLGGRRITAKVFVGGLGRECQSTLSCNILVMKSSGTAARQGERVAQQTASVIKPPPPVAKPNTPVIKPTTPAVRPNATIAKPATSASKPTAERRVDEGGVRRLDAYDDLALDLEKTHLASFARELRSAPDSQGYIIVYGGRCSAGNQAIERAERAKEWLINRHGIDASRIVAIDGGYRETLTTEIYIGAIDATLPELKSSIQPLDQSRCK